MMGWDGMEGVVKGNGGKAKSSCFLPSFFFLLTSSSSSFLFDFFSLKGGRALACALSLSLFLLDLLV